MEEHMKNKFYLFLSTFFLSLMLSITAFAGSWKKDAVGWWYERDNKTYPASAWEQVDGSWYCFNENGYMLSNQWVGNYYVGSSGVMLTNTVVDGKQLGADGAYKGNSSQKSGAASASSSGNTSAANTQSYDYILNKNTHKFHRPNCSAVSKMKEKNKVSFHGTRDEAISKGYSPCQICKP
jgi:nuclease-like protein